MDYLPYVTFRRAVAPESQLGMVRAHHTHQGDVTNGARGTDRPVSLSPGEQIDLSFTAPPLQAGYRRVVVFHTTGHYEGIGRSSGSAAVDTTFCFDQNYPNPFNPSTSFRFSLPKAEQVRLEIFNILGQQVVTVVDEQLGAGRHTVEWNGTGRDGALVSSGVYFARLTAGAVAATRKMVVVK